MRKITWMLGLLLSGALATSSAQAFGVGFGVDCDFAGTCFFPSRLEIEAGDSVTFFIYCDSGDRYEPHNVVADDGSFRCARGCDGEGGDGTPASCDAQWSFTRTFNQPGIFRYHSEPGGEQGLIDVRPRAAPSGSGLTGMWYNPQQSGHGFAIEFLPTDPPQLSVTWLVFRPDGGQTWILAAGQLIGNQGILAADLGGLPIPPWPVYDPDYSTPGSWGTLAVSFSDCNHARVEWSSLDPAYGTGALDLTRLTLPAGVTCE